MKRSFRVIPIFAAAVVLALIAVQGSAAPLAPSGAPELLWTAVAASGQVEANAGGSCIANWRRLVRGSTVPALTRVKTQQRSRATLTRGGDIILVSARSEVTLPGISDGPAMVIRQNSGKALYQFEPRQDGRVEILTPYLVAGVKGTVFSVIVEAEYTSVSVVSGHVEVRSLLTGELVDLFAGDMALFESRDGGLTVHSDRAEVAGRAPISLSPSANQSRKETGQLVRTASRDELSWEAEETDLWEDFADETWLDPGKEITRERDTTLLKDDQVTTKAEEDVRNVLCRTVKCY